MKPTLNESCANSKDPEPEALKHVFPKWFEKGLISKGYIIELYDLEGKNKLRTWRSDMKNKYEYIIKCGITDDYEIKLVRNKK